MLCPERSTPSRCTSRAVRWRAPRSSSRGASPLRQGDSGAPPRSQRATCTPLARDRASRRTRSGAWRWLPLRFARGLHPAPRATCALRACTRRAPRAAAPSPRPPHRGTGARPDGAPAPLPRRTPPRFHRPARGALPARRTRGCAGRCRCRGCPWPPRRRWPGGRCRPGFGGRRLPCAAAPRVRRCEFQRECVPPRRSDLPRAGRRAPRDPGAGRQSSPVGSGCEPLPRPGCGALHERRGVLQLRLPPHRRPERSR